MEGQTHKLDKPNSTHNNVEGTSQEVRPREAIEKDLEEIEQNIAKFGEELQPYEDRLTGFENEVQEHASIFAEKLFSPEEPLPAEAEVISNAPEELKPFAQELYAFAIRFRALDKIQKGLEQEVLPYVIEEFTNKLRLVSNIDYDGLVLHHAERDRERGKFQSYRDGFQTDMSSLMSLRKYQYEAEHAPEAIDYHYAKSSIRDIELIERSFQEKDFIRESKSSDLDKLFTVANPETLESLRLEILRVSANLAEYTSFTQTYGLWGVNHTHYDEEFSSMVKALDLKSLPGSSRDWLHPVDSHTTVSREELGLDPKFVAAVQTHVHKRIAEHAMAGRIPRTSESLAALQAEIDSADTQHAIESVSFEDFSISAGEKMAISLEDLRENITTYIPSSFISKLKTIKHSQERKKREDDPNVETIGSCKPVWGKDELEGFSIEIYEDLILKEGEGEIEEEYLKRKFLSTLWHEIAHVVHHQRLDYDDMSSWEYVLKQDTTAVTWYVQDSRESSSSSNILGSKGKREDFAETLALFLSNPHLLSVISPERYDYMDRLFEKYMPTERHTEFTTRIIRKRAIDTVINREMGMTDEKLKEIYLSHEKKEHD